MKNLSDRVIEENISGTFFSRFIIELFGNSAIFPLANILLELLIENPAEYLRVSDLYAIIFSALIQAYWLTSQPTARPRRLVGNLIAPTIYTFIESLLEGLLFFSAPHHLAYWGFAFAIGLFQEMAFWFPNLSSVLIIVENIIRTSILFSMYAIFESHANPQQTLSWSTFFSDASHVFIGIAIFLIGLSIGLANMSAERHLKKLRQTSAQLRTYSEWLLGRELLVQTFLNPGSLHTTRRERTVLFMDIRGLTAWSESHQPEEVVALLDNYYRQSELILTLHSAIKFKFAADEVMAIFATADSALQAAVELRQQVNLLLAEKQLGAGIGLESGLVVEGLLGSTGVKFYDAIGDTVNVAKRIESVAWAGEVLISENVRKKAQLTVKIDTRRDIQVKGKTEVISIYALEDTKAG